MKQIKRFYKDVTVAGREEGYAIQVDGRPVKTLDGGVLHAPSLALAEAIASEWRDQRAQ